MSARTFQDDIIDVNQPFKSSGEEGVTEEELPPPYEYPKVDFNSGWRDTAFGIIFWIQVVIVTIIAVVLSVLFMRNIPKQITLSQNFTQGMKEIRNVTDPYIKASIYGFGGAVGTSILVSIVTYFALQLCGGHVILCTVIISIIMEISLGIFLGLTIHWGASILPFLLLTITLISFACIRKRIPFSEAHVRVGCAVLHSHPSLILIALAMMIIEILWMVICGCVIVGAHLGLRSYNQVNTTAIDAVNKTGHNQTDTTNGPASALQSIIGFFLLVSWYWGASVFANIINFVTACAVAHWWFGDNSGQQYSVGVAVKRAFTTNFGTICLGSLLEALVKAARSSAENRKSNNIFTCLAVCILRIVEKIVGYINDWAFVYSALTGESFVEASRSFVSLFKKRGWTMVVNDVIVASGLGTINFVVGLTSATVGGVTVYMFLRNAPLGHLIATVIIAVFISFLIGMSISSVITTILVSCVRAIFVCFAMNPAALGATHPEDLQRLTNAWYKFYPQEFATSGYSKYYPMPYTPDQV